MPPIYILAVSVSPSALNMINNLKLLVFINLCARVVFSFVVFFAMCFLIFTVYFSIFVFQNIIHEFQKFVQNHEIFLLPIEIFLCKMIELFV